MMYPVIRKLQHKRVVLASASPRRQEILSQAGLRFEVVPSRFKEKLNKASFPTPHAYAIETAKQKALDVARRIHQKDLRAPDIIIGADTIVTIEGLILEKPVDKQDAYQMLSRLNGKEHSVFTGVAIIHCFSQDGQLDVEISQFYEETVVIFSQLSEELQSAFTFCKPGTSWSRNPLFSGEEGSVDDYTLLSLLTSTFGVCCRMASSPCVASSS